MAHHRVRDATHQRPVHAAQAPAAHHDQARSHPFGRDDDLLVRASHREVSPRNGSSRRLHLLDLLVQVLQSLRAHVLTAANLDEAERLLSVHKIHLVVSDMRLPDGTGLDLIHWVRRQHRGIRGVPCIAVTGFEQQFPATAATGFNAYMRKPINVDRFCDVAVALARA